jgi:hypothetical protein
MPRARLLPTALLLVLLPARAAAEAPAHVHRLEYVRGPGAERCPDEQAFRDAVGAQARRDLFAPSAPDRLTVTILRHGRGYEATAETRDPSGAMTWSRPLPPRPTCASLVDDLATAISVQLDRVGPPPALPSVSPPPPPLSPPPSSALPPVNAPPSRVDAPSSPAERPRFRLGAAAWMDLAAAPRPAFGLSLDAGIRIAWFSVAMEGRWDPPAGSNIGGADVTSTRITGAVVPCGHVSWFMGCALVEVGEIRGSASGGGVLMADSRAGLYAAAGGRLGVEIPLASHVSFRVVADAVGAFQRPTIRVDGQDRWGSPAFAGGLGVGLATFF